MTFYDPTPEHLSKLALPWIASYSGGKDSTSLVTWVEWLRRSGGVSVPEPKLVLSDTGVEDGDLASVARDMMAVLRASGWHCEVVRPEVHERLYNRILGIGNIPVHPGFRRMRWCTRSTKIDPMQRWRDEHGIGLALTGLRLGESSMRDGKLKSVGCAAGGECGIPDPSERTYSPILRWRTCQVVDWLTGAVGADVRSLMRDVFAVSLRLVEAYDVRVSKYVSLFGDEESVVSASRFGCVGCPAIEAGRTAPRSVVARHGAGSAVGELYDVWVEARLKKNRCYSPAKRHTASEYAGWGPIKIEARRRLFARVVDIQSRAGVVLVTAEDEAFIRECWERKVYPRGWSEADESVEPLTFLGIN